MQVSLDDLSLEITHQDERILISVGDDQFAEQRKEVLDLLTRVMPSKTPGIDDHTEQAGDPFDRLEAEMAADDVDAAADMRNSVQELSAQNIIPQLITDGSYQASTTEVRDLAGWLNRRQITLCAGENKTELEPIRFAALFWSRQLLQAALDRR